MNGLVGYFFPSSVSSCLDLLGAVGELLQSVGADGQADRSPASSVSGWYCESSRPSLRLVCRLFVIRADLAHRRTPGSVSRPALPLPIRAGSLSCTSRRSVQRRRDQLCAGLGCGGGLHRPRQASVMLPVDAFLLQHFPSRGCFPRGGQLDQDGFLSMPASPVSPVMISRFDDRRGDCEGQAGRPLPSIRRPDDLQISYRKRSAVFDYCAHPPPGPCSHAA